MPRLDYYLSMHFCRALDDSIEILVDKYYTNARRFPKPVHLNICLGRDTPFSDLIKVIFRKID